MKTYILCCVPGAAMLSGCRPHNERSQTSCPECNGRFKAERCFGKIEKHENGFRVTVPVGLLQ